MAAGNGGREHLGPGGPVHPGSSDHRWGVPRGFAAAGTQRTIEERAVEFGISPGQARCAHKVTSSKANEAKVTPMGKKRRRRIRRHRTATLPEPPQDLAALELHRQKRHAKLAAMADFIQRLRPTQNTQDRPRDQAGRNSPKERREESRSVDEGGFA